MKKDPIMTNSWKHFFNKLTNSFQSFLHIQREGKASWCPKGNKSIQCSDQKTENEMLLGWTRPVGSLVGTYNRCELYDVLLRVLRSLGTKGVRYREGKIEFSILEQNADWL